jgi:hypothetical protein
MERHRQTARRSHKSSFFHPRNKESKLKMELSSRNVTLWFQCYNELNLRRFYLWLVFVSAVSRYVRGISVLAPGIPTSEMRDLLAHAKWMSLKFAPCWDRLKIILALPMLDHSKGHLNHSFQLRMCWITGWIVVKVDWITFNTCYNRVFQMRSE